MTKKPHGCQPFFLKKIKCSKVIYILFFLVDYLGMSVSADGFFNLRGKVAMVTGGGHGLGLDIASALASAGCDVIITSRIFEKAEAVAGGLRSQYGGQVLALGLDQRDPAHVAECFSGVASWVRKAAHPKGRLDILVNNAGGGASSGPTNFFERRAEDIEEMISVNLTGMIFCCQQAARIMAGQRSGKIINISSVAALVGRGRQLYHDTGLAEQAVDYAAAKAGVLGLTRDLAAVLAPYNAQVNAISPGGFEKNQPPAFIAGYSALTMLGRMGQLGSDIKGVALFLASSASDYVTGQNLVVDGGFSAVK